MLTTGVVKCVVITAKKGEGEGMLYNTWILEKHILGIIKLFCVNCSSNLNVRVMYSELHNNLEHVWQCP